MAAAYTYAQGVLDVGGGSGQHVATVLLLTFHCNTLSVRRMALRTQRRLGRLLVAMLQS